MIKGLICLIPLRGGKVEAGKQGNKYFLVEKAWCYKPKFDNRDQYFFFLGRNSGKVTVNVSFAYGGYQNVFSWEWEDKGLLFLLFQSQKEEIEGGTPKQKLKTIEVVFIYSKRSTGFWYCERYQSPEKTSGIPNCDQNLFSFLLFQIFFKVYQNSQE